MDELYHIPEIPIITLIRSRIISRELKGLREIQNKGMNFCIVNKIMLICQDRKCDNWINHEYNGNNPSLENNEMVSKFVKIKLLKKMKKISLNKRILEAIDWIKKYFNKKWLLLLLAYIIGTKDIILNSKNIHNWSQFFEKIEKIIELIIIKKEKYLNKLKINKGKIFFRVWTY